MFLLTPLLIQPALAGELIVHSHLLFSRQLQREVKLEVLLPPSYPQGRTKYPVLYMNDGQNLEALQLKSTLGRLYAEDSIREIIAVAIHAGDRLQEYGTAAMADYAGRGSKAAAYTRFMIQELIPFLKTHYRLLTQDKQNAVIGFSLGGLSAFDMAWNHPEVFGKTGAFSGSFWWRQKSTDDDFDEQRDRIMHLLVRQGSYKKGLKIWLQAGTAEEDSDRNNNGIIDVVDDVLDLIKELEAKGYQKDKDIRYLQIEGGKHDEATWSNCLPDFLKWAYGK